MHSVCRRLNLVVVVALFSIFALGARVHAEKTDLELLQGTWVCVATAKDGKAVDAYVGVRAKIEGDNLTWYFPQKDGTFREQKNKFRIDPSKNPKQFDWWPADKPNSIDQRVYTVDDKLLRMSTNLDGKTRPARIDAGRWVFDCKRFEAQQPGATETANAAWGTPIDPDSDCTIRHDDGKITIQVPGTKHDLFYGGTDPQRRFNAPRVMRNVEGDFVARVKVSGDWMLAPEGGYNGGGLVVWDSENQYLRLERNRYVRTTEPHGPYSYITPLYDHNGKRAQHRTSTDELFTGRSSWLRIERVGKEITTSISNDGNAWTQTGKLTAEFPPRVAVGVFVINTSPRGFVAEFENFKILSE